MNSLRKLKPLDFQFRLLGPDFGGLLSLLKQIYCCQYGQIEGSDTLRLNRVKNPPHKMEQIPNNTFY